ncbi:hypothetical protein [Trueperella pyogenes]
MKHNPKWNYRPLSTLPDAYNRADVATTQQLEQLESELWTHYHAVVSPELAQRNTMTFGDCLHSGRVCKDIGIIAWGKAGKVVVPFQDATALDRLHLYYSAGSALKDLRRHKGYARDVAANGTLSQHGYRRYIYLARKLNDEERELFQAKEHFELWDKELGIILGSSSDPWLAHHNEGIAQGN